METEWLEVTKCAFLGRSAGCATGTKQWKEALQQQRRAADNGIKTAAEPSSYKLYIAQKPRPIVTFWPRHPCSSLHTFFMCESGPEDIASQLATRCAENHFSLPSRLHQRPAALADAANEVGLN